MAHVDREELAVYAGDPDAIDAARRAEIERELAGCVECRTSFEFLAVADDELSDPDVWEPVTGSAALDSLRAHGARIAAEDADAAVLLQPLLGDPVRVAWRSFGSKRYRTGGVVRKLLAHAATLHEREPLEALTFADAALSIAEELPDDTYPAKAVYELRGSAWKERASALRILGRFDEGLESLRRAERAYRVLTWSALGVASVAYVRGLIFLEQERYDEASAAAVIAERTFSSVADEDRQLAALHLRAFIAFERREIETAILLFSRVSEQAELDRGELWIARSAQALGTCYLDAGRPSEASVQFHKALALFRKLGQQTEITRTEWGVARLIMHGGKFDEAIRRLRETGKNLRTVGLTTVTQAVARTSTAPT